MHSDALCEAIVTSMLILPMICPRQGNHSIRLKVPLSFGADARVSGDDVRERRMTVCFLTPWAGLEYSSPQVMKSRMCRACRIIERIEKVGLVLKVRGVPGQERVQGRFRRSVR